MPSFSANLIYLAALAPFMHVQADSTVFSHFIGATTASAPSGALVTSFSICTDYLQGLPPLTNIAFDQSTLLEQMAVDGVCRYCTSVNQARIDSCCGQATSSACFDHFGGSSAVPTTPAFGSTVPTATAAGGLSSTHSNVSNGGVIAKVCQQYMVVIDADPRRTNISLLVPSSQPWSASLDGDCREMLDW